ncbi:MAG: T9SS type A sorting domain-containing protein [Bacteroidales bacterium]|nr:T9SS type A sorting domain-containing protein [Bacteroidales bacterium]
MKRTKYIISLLLILASTLHAQPWEQNNAIFNPSGIPSLPFSQPRFADLDDDGDYDMIIGSSDYRLVYLENTGSATTPAFIQGEGLFSGISTLDAEVGVFYDIDNDGDLDLITGGFTGLNLFANTGSAGNPVFEKVTGFFDGLDVGMNPVPDLADLDNDMDPDLITGLSESGILKIYINTGTPSSAQFTEGNSTIIGDVGLYAYPVFHDLDSDGDQDILSGRDEHGFIYYQNTGTMVNPIWETNTTVFEGTGDLTYWNSPDLVDLNGDSKPDLVFGSASGPLNYYLNAGSPAAPVWQENTTLFGGVLDVGGASNPYFFDFDYDGDLDLFSGSQLGDIKYFENIGTATGPAWLENSGYFTSLKHSIYSAVAIGDVNGDSLPDAIVGDLSGKLYYHRNTGSGFVLVSIALGNINLGGWSSPRLVDLDMDGDLDIVAGNEAGNLAYIQNQGTPASPFWALIPNYFAGIDVGSNCVPAIADIDQDGDPDILTGNLWGDVQYFENQGTSWIENPGPFQGITGGQNATTALADLDADGDPDLTMGEYGGTFDYYKNNAIIAGLGEQPLSSFSPSLSAYPNPFSGSVTFRFCLASETDVVMQVTDIRGGIVLTEKRAGMNAGQHLWKWDGAKVLPGLYLLHILTGERSGTIKIVRI